MVGGLVDWWVSQDMAAAACRMRRLLGYASSEAGTSAYVWLLSMPA